MIISIKALIKLLLRNNYKYVMEPASQEFFAGRNVINFVVNNSYPHHQSISIGTNEEIEASTKERVAKKDGIIILQYDMDTSKILSVIADIHNIIKTAKNEAIARQCFSSREVQCTT